MKFHYEILQNNIWKEIQLDSMKLRFAWALSLLSFVLDRMNDVWAQNFSRKCKISADEKGSRRCSRNMSFLLSETSFQSSKC